MPSSSNTPTSEFKMPIKIPLKARRKLILEPVRLQSKKSSPAKAPSKVRATASFLDRLEKEIAGNPDREAAALLRKHKACISRLENKIAKNQATLELLRTALREDDKPIILPRQRLKHCEKKVLHDLEKGVFKRDFLRNKIEVELDIRDGSD